MFIFSIMASMIRAVKLPSFRSVKNVSADIGKLTGRVGRSLNPVHPRLIVKSCKELLESFRHVKDFYHNHILSRFRQVKSNLGAMACSFQDILGSLRPEDASKGGRGGTSLKTSLLKRYGHLSTMVMEVNVTLNDLSENKVMEQLHSIETQLAAVGTARLLEQIAQEKESSEPVVELYDGYSQYPVAQASTVNPIYVEAHVIEDYRPSAPPLSEGYSVTPSAPISYEDVERDALNLAQVKLGTLADKVEQLLHILSQDLIPGAQRFSTHAESISKSYQGVFVENNKKEPVFLSHFQHVLEKESAGLHLMDEFRQDDELRRKLSSTTVIPQRVKMVHHDMCQMKEDADLIVARFNSIKTFLQEESMRTQIALLKSDLAVVQYDDDTFSRVREMVCKSLDQLSQKLGTLEVFVQRFEQNELPCLLDFIQSPDSSFQTMLHEVHELCTK